MTKQMTIDDGRVLMKVDAMRKAKRNISNSEKAEPKQMTIYDGIALTTMDAMRLQKEARILFDVLTRLQWQTKEEITKMTGLSTITINSQFQIFKKDLNATHILKKRMRWGTKLYEYMLDEVNDSTVL